MKNDCEGCIVYRNKYGEDEPHCRVGIIPYISESLQCPCRSCIVKMVCKEDTCDKYRTYITQSNKFRRENNV